MKKLFILLSAGILLISFAGCSNNDDENTIRNESSQITETTSSAPSQPENSQISIIRPESSASESSEESRLPDGITEGQDGMLNYINKTANLKVNFPKEFNTLSTEYKPAAGIYLQNSEGTATLQIEAVKNEGITKSDLTEYLKKKYTSASVSEDATKNILCKTTVKNSKGQTVASYLKAEVTTEGYNEIILYFQPSEKDIYESVFDKINFS